MAAEQSRARRLRTLRDSKTHISLGRAISAAELPREIPEGCILSNELFDALPVHRVLYKNGALREMFVAVAVRTARKVTLRKASRQRHAIGGIRGDGPDLSAHQKLRSISSIRGSYCVKASSPRRAWRPAAGFWRRAAAWAAAFFSP